MNKSACPSSGTVRSVKKEHSVAAAIITYRILHRLILFNTAFGKLQPELKYLCHICWNGLKQDGNVLFTQCFSFQTVVCQVTFKLHNGVRIIQPGEFLHSSHKVFFGLFIDADSLFYELSVNHDASVVYFLIEMIFIPDEVRYRVILQPLLDLHFNLNVTAVVFLEQFPFIRCVPWQIPFTTGCSARHTEVTDEFLSFLKFLFLKAKYGTNLVE